MALLSTCLSPIESLAFSNASGEGQGVVYRVRVGKGTLIGLNPEDPVNPTAQQLCVCVCVYTL